METPPFHSSVDKVDRARQERIVEPGRGWKWAPAQALLSVGVGLGLGAGSDLGKMAAGALLAFAVAGAVVLRLSLRGFVIALVVASQFNGWRVPLLGFRFLPEHFVVVVLVVALLVRRPGLLVRRPATYEMLLLGWIVWNGAATMLFSPDVRESLAIVGWMLLAWMILWCARGYFSTEASSSRHILDLGARLAGLIGMIAFACWVGGLLGLWTFGLQQEYVTGTVAARGFSVEANLFGSLQLFWVFLLLRWRVVNDRPVPPVVLLGLVLGIIASMTRAVWVAAIVVIAVTLLVEQDKRRRGRAALGGRARPQTVAVFLVGLVAIVGFGAPAATKFQGVLDFGSSTGAERARNWKIAIDDLTESRSYLLGRGTNSFGQRHLSRTVAGEPDYLGNLALTVLYDTGVVGVLLFGGALLAFVFHRHQGYGRLFKALFVVALLMVGAAATPIWFGYVWIALAAIDVAWSRENFDEAVVVDAAMVRNSTEESPHATLATSSLASHRASAYPGNGDG